MNDMKNSDVGEVILYLSIFGSFCSFSCFKVDRTLGLQNFKEDRRNGRVKKVLHDTDDEGG